MQLASVRACPACPGGATTGKLGVQLDKEYGAAGPRRPGEKVKAIPPVCSK
jgi:hypothetical protein